MFPRSTYLTPPSAVTQLAKASNAEYTMLSVLLNVTSSPEYLDRCIVSFAPFDTQSYVSQVKNIAKATKRLVLAIALRRFGIAC